MLKKVILWLISRAPFYFLFFVLPIIAMNNCQGWNAGNMASKSCNTDHWIVYEYTDFYYAFVMLSSFALLLPLLFYLLFFIVVSEFLGYLLLKKIGVKKDT